MEREIIYSNKSIVCFDKNVLASKLNKSFDDFRGHVVIKGNIILDEDLFTRYNLGVIGDILPKPYRKAKITIGGNLACDGNMKIYGNIKVSGNLFCEGCMDVGCITVGGKLSCKGNMDTGAISVGSDFYCGGNINRNERKIRVKGDFYCAGTIDKHRRKIRVKGNFNY